MRKFRPLVLLSLLLALAFACATSCEVVRYVSPTNGTDNSSCLNSNDSIKNPCRTLSFALVGKEINSTQSDYCNISTGPDNLCVYLHDGIHYLSGETQVTNATNLFVESLRPGGAVVRCRSFPNNVPNQWDDIMFFCSRNITVSDLIFEHCGPFASGVYAYKVDGLHIQNCAFRNITGVPVNIRETTGVTVRNCTFFDNHNKLPSFHSVNSNDTTSADELNHLSVPSGGISLYSNGTFSLEVDNCTFVNNSGNINLPYVQRPVQLKSGGHGGAIYLQLSEANFSNVSIHNSNFDSNNAEINGGAIIFSLKRTRKSIFRIDKCNFINNRALTTSGGALTVELSSRTESNLFAVESCTFKQNSAVGGGALSVVVYDFHSGREEEEEGLVDQIVLCNSSFVGNYAMWEGSALGLFSFSTSEAFPYEVEIQDCIFSGNQVSVTEVEAVEEQGSIPWHAAIFSFRFPLRFTGINQLLDNVGGGLSVVGTIVRVDGSLLVHNNTANYGGGIYLEGLCLLVLFPESILELHNNKALEAGGGLFVDVSFRNTFTHVVDNDESNRFCFMQYQSLDWKKYPPSKWKNVSISFINNTASSAGAAFYASSVSECSWLDTPTGGNTTTTGTDSPYTIFTPPEGLASPFTFSDNNLTSTRLGGQTVNNEAMATNAIHADVEYLLTEFTVQPGEKLEAQLVTLDAFGNNRGTAIEVHIFKDSHFQDATSDHGPHMLTLRVPSISTLAGGSRIRQKRSGPHGTDSQEARPTINMEITLLKTDVHVSSSQTFNVTQCHPGYVLEGEVCICNDRHPDIYRCDGSFRYVYIREGRYAWVHEDDAKLSLVSGTPPSFLHCSRQGELPGCLFMFDQVDQQCADGRTGFLCGSCPAGTAVSLDLQFCSDKCEMGIIVFIIMCVGVVLISLFILAKDVQLPPELRGFIFYAQVIGLVFGPFSNVIGRELKGLRHFLNLLTFSVPLPWCVSTTLPTHGVALLGYISPVLALTTLIVYTFIAKYVSAVSSRGVTHGLSLLGVFIYKYLADTSFVTVSCRRRTSAQGFVFLYDGTQSCSAASFLPFFVIGIGVIVLFVIPVPFVLCVLTTKRWQVCDMYHFTDELTKDMREGRGWYAGWDVGRRLLFIIVFYAGVYFDSSLISVLMFLLALFVLVFHCFIKPYKEETSNVVETLILLNLVLVAAAYLEAPHGQAGSVFVVILTVLPYLYAVGFLMWVAGKKNYSKCGSHVQRCLPEKLISTLPALSRPKNEPVPAGNIPLRTVRRRQDHHEPVKQKGGSISAESAASTAGAERSSDTHKAVSKQQGMGRHSDLCTQRKAEEMPKETLTDKLFDLGGDDIKELCRNSFIHSYK